MDDKNGETTQNAFSDPTGYKAWVPSSMDNTRYVSATIAGQDMTGLGDQTVATDSPGFTKTSVANMQYFATLLY